MSAQADLSVEVGCLHLKNPVLTASGTFGYGVEFARFFDLSRLGGFCTKGLSLEPMAGNPPGRIAETPAGMLNAIGLENVGTEAFVREKLPLLADCGCHVIANVLGKTTSEFIAIVERLTPFAKVSAFELNVSCPNIKEGGVQFGHDPDLTRQVVAAVRAATDKPVWVKLSPNVTDITVFAQACEDAGADAITLVNTFVGWPSMSCVAAPCCRTSRADFPGRRSGLWRSAWCTSVHGRSAFRWSESEASPAPETRWSS
jgi:dihydroorotate dehydrogenase (NAD+) catalytic subunit